MKKYLALILLCFLSSTSCNVPVKGGPTRKGDLQILRPVSSISNLCELKAVFYNENEKQEIEPVVQLLFFNSSKNTISKETITFNLILAGKRQIKTFFIHDFCQNISTARIEGAYDDIHHMRGLGFKIDGLPDGRILRVWPQ